MALTGLAETPDDVRLLRLAGQSSLALDLDEAADYLQRLVRVAPDDGEAWLALGRARCNAGDEVAAADAFRKAVQLLPRDARPLIDLGHTLYALDQTDEAIATLSRATQLDPGNLGALRSLVEMHRHAGNLQAAQGAANRITELQPEDVLAALDSAELNLALGNPDAALVDYSRLRTIDTVEGHQAQVYHGMIEVEMRRERWRHALDLAIDATRFDRDELTTLLLACVASKLFGDGDRPAPTPAELEARLAVEHAEHRLFHAEALTPQ